VYFRCLDKNGIIDSIGEKDKAEKGCASEGRGFEANCASSWVSRYSCIWNGSWEGWASRRMLFGLGQKIWSRC
jgi:Cytochrome oxidase c subunit VIb